MGFNAFGLLVIGLGVLLVIGGAHGAGIIGSGSTSSSPSESVGGGGTAGNSGAPSTSNIGGRGSNGQGTATAGGIGGGTAPTAQGRLTQRINPGAAGL